MLKNKIFLYFLFALLASIVNVIGQHIFLNYNENLFFAVIAGSAAGLVFKYVLDSSIVFEGKKPINIRTFLIYASFGACITPVIWIVEVIFLNIYGQNVPVRTYIYGTISLSTEISRHESLRCIHGGIEVV